MKKLKESSGVAMIIAGALALAATRIDSLSSNNTLLATGLLLIIIGMLLHIFLIKHASAY
jgi:uncharacterized membrane protein HdeD (DUF308 family)